MSRKFSVLALASILAVGGGALGYTQFAGPKGLAAHKCSTPLVNLTAANKKMCVEFGFSWVDVVFPQPVDFGKFNRKVVSVPGLDIQNSTGDPKGHGFRLVFYMSRTSDAAFVSKVITIADDPDLFL